MTCTLANMPPLLEPQPADITFLFVVSELFLSQSYYFFLQHLLRTVHETQALLPALDEQEVNEELSEYLH